jgi:hypothetical protein
MKSVTSECYADSRAIWTRTAVFAVFCSLLLASCASSPPKRIEKEKPGTPVVSQVEPIPEKGEEARDVKVPDPLTRPEEPQAEVPRLSDGRIGPVQEKLVEGACVFVGKNQIVVNGRTFPADCSGTILGIYAYAGIDLSSEFPKYSGNGVNRIYCILRDKGLLYDTKRPAPGDIIFWDNTYDKNEDGVLNDSLTHIGMIVRSSGDGRAEYVHFHYTRGIVIENMDLERPDLYSEIVDGEKVIVNAPLKMKGLSKEDGWLAGQLYNALGKGYELEKQGKN